MKRLQLDHKNFAKLSSSDLIDKTPYYLLIKESDKMSVVFCFEKVDIHVRATNLPKLHTFNITDHFVRYVISTGRRDRDYPRLL